MNIKVNAKELSNTEVKEDEMGELGKKLEIGHLKKYTKYLNSKKLIYIQNGFLVNKASGVKENDDLYLIPKDMDICEEDMECFLSSRHSPKVIDKLKNAKVAILGLGGLGSNVAMNLARSGVSYIKLVDFDIVDPSNINRQNYFLDQIGMYKSDASLENLRRINPYIKYDSVKVYLDKSNYKSYLEDVQIIVEAFDNPVCKADITKDFIEHYNDDYADKYLITSSGMAGFYNSNIIKTKKLRDRLYMCGDFKNSAREFEGLMAPRVTIVAGHQSNCVIRILMEEMEV